MCVCVYASYGIFLCVILIKSFDQSGPCYILGDVRYSVSWHREAVRNLIFVFRLLLAVFWGLLSLLCLLNLASSSYHFICLIPSLTGRIFSWWWNAILVLFCFNPWFVWIVQKFNLLDLFTNYNFSRQNLALKDGLLELLKHNIVNWKIFVLKASVFQGSCYQVAHSVKLAEINYKSYKKELAVS